MINHITVLAQTGNTDSQTLRRTHTIRSADRQSWEKSQVARAAKRGWSSPSRPHERYPDKTFLSTFLDKKGRVSSYPVNFGAFATLAILILTSYHICDVTGEQSRCLNPSEAACCLTVCLAKAARSGVEVL